MENSAMPEIDALAQTIIALADGEPHFYNLNVEFAQELLTGPPEGFHNGQDHVRSTRLWHWSSSLHRADDP